ncbi:unnamed protein product [Prunus armeniaca]
MQLRRINTWELTSLPEGREKVQAEWRCGSLQDKVSSQRLQAKTRTLEEEVYLEQPWGYVKEGQADMVYKLKKALYGLKQAPRAWYTRIDSYFIKHKFQRCPYEHTLYVKNNQQGDVVIVCVYVDDLIIASNNMRLVAEFREALTSQFEMTDMGLMSYFLSIEDMQTEQGTFMSQRKYVVTSSNVLK